MLSLHGKNAERKCIGPLFTSSKPCFVVKSEVNDIELTTRSIHEVRAFAKRRKEIRNENNNEKMEL